MPQPRHIYAWDRLVLQLAGGLVNSRHRHFGSFLLLAPDAPIEIHTDSNQPVACQAALVAPNAWHRLDSRRSRVATLLIGPDHPWFGYVTPLLGGLPITQLSLPLVTPSECDWNRVFDGDENCSYVQSLLERILTLLSEQAFVPHAIDPQIRIVIRLIEDGLTSNVNVGAVAREVGLSPVTLMRRFKRELGVRIREYVLWRRLLNAIPLLDGRRTLTEIAQLTGFYDQAHLTRTSRRMFDLQPSDVSAAGRARIHVCP